MAYEGTLRNIPGQVASADLSSNQFKFVSIGATGVALHTTPGTLPDGVLQNAPAAANRAAEVAFGGVSKVVAGAAIAKGARVMVSATGLAVTGTATNIGAGTALEAASASGDIIAVLLDSKGDTLA